MNANQLNLLIIDTLSKFEKLYLTEAVNLLMGTAAQESHLGQYIQQLGSGPALGIFQMEPATFRDIIENYLYYKPALLSQVLKVCNVQHLEPECLKYNLRVAIVFCRLHYLRNPEKIPNTIEGMAKYWKKYYNTHLGKGTEQEFILNYRRLVV
ncbi:hypothetical protein [uncultured Sunxiuqinia sp.]|uniref:hypothetical protein n=1 Tax=uncultured Sunxiuqinia sp. TaxID=1573825 RepID=UPI002620D242|nr:hypothetical protein [uncultured Sunxiuqinia sp.]